MICMIVKTLIIFLFLFLLHAFNLLNTMESPARPFFPYKPSSCLGHGKPYLPIFSDTSTCHVGRWKASLAHLQVPVLVLAEKWTWLALFLTQSVSFLNILLAFPKINKFWNYYKLQNKVIFWKWHGLWLNLFFCIMFGCWKI